MLRARALLCRIVEGIITLVQHESNGTISDVSQWEIYLREYGYILLHPDVLTIISKILSCEDQQRYYVQ